MPDRTTTTTTYGPDGKVTGTTTVTYAISTEQGNRDAIVADLMTAMAANRTFLAIPTLTVGLSVNAQVQALTKQNLALIRLVLDLLDATN